MMRWILAIRGCTFQNPKVSMDQFKIISTIGRGFYGKVMLVQHKKTGQMLAIKSIQKWKLVQTKKIDTVLIERSILEKTKFPFIVEMKYAFQTPKKFYLVLEYIAGGELFFHMQKNGTFPMDVVKLYIAEITLALNYLHSNGIVYRDLKPENVLIDIDGHIKLTDFGLSKLAAETSTFCGTNEYLAPEIIARHSYSYSIDYWSLGILTYEMLFGRTPWASQNNAVLFNNIVHADLLFPAEATPEAIDFLTFVLVKDPRKRPGFQEIIHHPFFKEYDFQRVLNKGYTPGFIPKITNQFDPSNFDNEFVSEIANDSSAASIGDHENDYLPGFSYTADHQIGPQSKPNHLDEIIQNEDSISEDFMNSDSSSDSSNFSSPPINQNSPHVLLAAPIA